MTVSCIAAMSENRVIGAGGGLPWRLPSDLKHFRRTTMGHAVIMGRRTWESIGRPLPGRTSIVLTRRTDYSVPEGVLVAASLPDAIALAGADDEAFVVGGGVVFAGAMESCDRLYLTVIHADVAGDTLFPAVEEGIWNLVSEDRREADDRNPHAHTFRVYERRR